MYINNQGYQSMAFFYDLPTYYLYQPIGDKLILINYNNDLREVLRHNHRLLQLSFIALQVIYYVRLG